MTQTEFNDFVNKLGMDLLQIRADAVYTISQKVRELNLFPEKELEAQRQAVAYIYSLLR